MIDLGVTFIIEAIMLPRETKSEQDLILQGKLDLFLLNMLIEKKLGLVLNGFYEGDYFFTRDIRIAYRDIIIQLPKHLPTLSLFSGITVEQQNKELNDVIDLEHHTESNNDIFENSDVRKEIMPDVSDDIINETDDNSDTVFRSISVFDSSYNQTFYFNQYGKVLW